MAGIDKIYGTEDQFIELKNWLAEHKPEALKYMYHEDYPNDWITRPISNFPEEIDMWLLDNCELDWVVSKIKEQYNLSSLIATNHMTPAGRWLAVVEVVDWIKVYQFDGEYFLEFKVDGSYAHVNSDSFECSVVECIYKVNKILKGG